MITNKLSSPLDQLKEEIVVAMQQLYTSDIKSIQFTLTPPHFQGDYSFPLFALAQQQQVSVASLGKLLKQELLIKSKWISSIEIAKGFLNITLKECYWTASYLDALEKLKHFPQYFTKKTACIAAEIACPNTNKPLHLGHLRNSFLGEAIANLLTFSGHNIVRIRHINDRGIHICQSMVGYLHFGKKTTPKSSSMKGDHFVGHYYISFHKAYKKQIAKLRADGLSEREAMKAAPLFQETLQMLIDWEQGKEEVLSLWKQMNNWVYEGFEQTFHRMGCSFDITYYESALYLRGKKMIEEGLAKGVYYKNPDGSIWVDLTQEGLDHKLLLRKDGTSIYITQDLGTADARYEDHRFNKALYVVGNEQNYHFQVLFAVLKKLGRSYADQMQHISYGMVELPEGKMKSREGTIVDADDLMEGMVQYAEKKSAALAKEKKTLLNSLSPIEKKKLYEMIGIGTLKYFLLKVHPTKRIIFHPDHSIDWQGDSCAFIQYTHARIHSLCQKAADKGILIIDHSPLFPMLNQLHPTEKELLSLLAATPDKLHEAAKNLNISLLPQHMYSIAKSFNAFYAQSSILEEPDPLYQEWKLHWTQNTAYLLKLLAKMLGIQLPNTM